MTYKTPSQTRVVLLLTASFLAGMIASTFVSPREPVRPDEPLPLIEQSLAAETP